MAHPLTIHHESHFKIAFTFILRPNKNSFHVRRQGIIYVYPRKFLLYVLYIIVIYLALAPCYYTPSVHYREVIKLFYIVLLNVEEDSFRDVFHIVLGIEG